MFRMTKRGYISNTNSILIRILAVVLALVTSSVFIKLMGHSPIKVYTSMLDGAFGSKYRILETLKVAIPIIIASIGIMIAFKMKFWNIGGEGQILMGAFFATYFALYHSELPKPILLIVMLIAGFIGGGLWALIPAFFKVKYGTNETIITLMLNYIAIKWIVHLQYGPWKDPNAMGFPKIANFTENAILPKVFGLHIGHRRKSGYCKIFRNEHQKNCAFIYICIWRHLWYCWIYPSFGSRSNFNVCTFCGIWFYCNNHNLVISATAEYYYSSFHIIFYPIIPDLIAV